MDCYSVLFDLSLQSQTPLPCSTRYAIGVGTVVALLSLSTSLPYEDGGGAFQALGGVLAPLIC